jgi:excisionase family DNA binding protein
LETDEEIYMDTAVIQPKLLTAKEVAELLRMPLSTVYYLAKTRKIPSIQIGHIWRFRKDEILRLVHY